MIRVIKPRAAACEMMGGGMGKELCPLCPPEELDGALRGASPSFEEAGAAHRWVTGSVAGLLRCGNPLLLSRNKTREPRVNF